MPLVPPWDAELDTIRLMIGISVDVKHFWQLEE